MVKINKIGRFFTNFCSLRPLCKLTVRDTGKNNGKNVVVEKCC